MLKRTLFFLATLSLILAACAGGQPAATTLPTLTQVAQATTPVTTPVSSAQAVPGCTVSSQQPTPGPTEQSLFPPVGAGDWVMGPSDAYVTFIEYGDFM
jgi:hypothetical protein